MHKFILINALCLLFALNGKAQANKEIQIRFMPTFEHKTVDFDDETYSLPKGDKGDSIVFEEFKCYISEVALYKGDEVVFRESNSFHLLDAQKEHSMGFVLKVPKEITYTGVKMNIGVDSVTSTSGALGGDLDPSKGMFWTWQSGYINLKLEGRSNVCPTRKNRFQFHLGGYELADNSLQRISINAAPGKNITIEIPLDKFVSDIDLAELNSIMSPGPEAVALSKKMAQLFEVKKN